MRNLRHCCTQLIFTEFQIRDSAHLFPVLTEAKKRSQWLLQKKSSLGMKCVYSKIFETLGLLMDGGRRDIARKHKIQLIVNILILIKPAYASSTTAQRASCQPTKYSSPLLQLENSQVNPHACQAPYWAASLPPPWQHLRQLKSLQHGF